MALKSKLFGCLLLLCGGLIASDCEIMGDLDAHREKVQNRFLVYIEFQMKQSSVKKIRKSGYEADVEDNDRFDKKDLIYVSYGRK